MYLTEKITFPLALVGSSFVFLREDHFLFAGEPSPRKPLTFQGFSKSSHISLLIGVTHNAVRCLGQVLASILDG